jgi:hypothetical protein
MKNLIIFIQFLLPLTVLAQIPDTIWTKTFGDSSYDAGYSMIQTNDNTFIISGSIGTQLSSNSFTTDIWLFGIDEDGIELWSHNYGSMSGGEIVKASNNEFFVAAETYSPGENMQILRINQIGDTIWTKTFFFPGQEYSPDIEKTPDGGLVMLEFSYGFPKGALLIKISELGDTLWTRFFTDDFYSLIPSSPQIDIDSGIVFLVQKYDSTFIYKTDSSGNLLWKEKICSSTYTANHLLTTQEGNYLILGTYKPSFDSSLIWVSMLDNELNTIWSHILFSTAVYAYATNIVKSNQSGYIVLGNEAIERFSPTDGFILQINDSGNLLWRKSYGGISSEHFYNIVQLENDEFIVVGETESFGAGKRDVWVLKFSTIVGVEENETNNIVSYTLSQNYPNPFNPSTKISWQSPIGSWQTIKVYDVLGNEVATLVNEYKPAGSYEVEFNASPLPSGVYFYQLRTRGPEINSGQGIVETKKMILLK